MQIVVNGDASFLQGWAFNYYGACPVTGMGPYPKDGSAAEVAAYKNSYMEALAKAIKSPVAFGIMSPVVNAAFDAALMQRHGWEPIAWSESSHNQKTPVQLWMRKFPDAEPKVRPVVPKQISGYSYNSEQKGTLPYMGCSAFLTDFPEPNETIELPKVHNTYAKGEKANNILHLLRVARPASLKGIRYLKENGFVRFHKGEWFQYFVRGKLGLGQKEMCEY